MKKPILAALLTLCTIFSVFGTTAHATTTLSDTMKEACYDAGYPYSYRGHLQSFYDYFAEETDGNPCFGDTTFSAFLLFIDSVEETSPTADMSNVEKLTRAMFLEVSNLSHKIDSLDGAADCLTNMLIVGNMGDDYCEVAQAALNGLNSASDNYLHNIMKRPIPCASGEGSSGKKALVHAYVNAYKMICNEEGCYPYYSEYLSPLQYERYSSLPTGYLFFNESYKYNRIKIGDFYFRKVY